MSAAVSLAISDPPTEHPESAAAAARLLAGYVSLGVNCEFGLVQRYCGAEPIDLLRFALTPLNGLMSQLATEFAAFESFRTIGIEADRDWTEFISVERTSKIGFHTDQRVGSRSVHDVIRQEVRRLPRLARKLVAELKEGARTAVYSRTSLTVPESIALHDALRHYGKIRLLVVVQAPTKNIVGSIVKLREGLLMGHLDRVTPIGFAKNPSLDVWLAILRTAPYLFLSRRLYDGTRVVPASDEYNIPADLPQAELWRARAAARRGQVGDALDLYASHQRRAGTVPEIDHEVQALASSRHSEQVECVM